jgi:DNA-directed RNA polymerase subunit RPC12/RpoP
LTAMPYFECIDCGEEFWREEDERWKVRCYDCWRHKKEAELAEREWEASELRRLQAEVKRLYQAQSESQVVLDGLRYHLTFLIFAAHPDRNGDDPRATEATKWLLEIRNLLRGGTV